MVVRQVGWLAGRGARCCLPGGDRETKSSQCSLWWRWARGWQRQRNRSWEPVALEWRRSVGGHFWLSDLAGRWANWRPHNQIARRHRVTGISGHVIDRWVHGCALVWSSSFCEPHLCVPPAQSARDVNAACQHTRCRRPLTYPAAAGTDKPARPEKMTC